MVSGGKTAGTTSGGAPKRPIKLSQEMVVVGISAFLFLIFSIGLDHFLSKGNIIALLKNVSILGTLAVGMGFVVVGRGIDLTMVAVMVVGVAFSIWIASWGIDFTPAVLIGAALVILIGLFTGIMIAFAEIPPIFATLASTRSPSFRWRTPRNWSPIGAAGSASSRSAIRRG